MAPKKPPGPKPRTPAPTDAHLWKEVGRSVAPLLRRKSADPKSLLEALASAPDTPPHPTRPLPAPAPRLKPVSGSLVPSAKARGQGKGVPVEDKSIEPGLKKRLRRGRLPIDSTLDLHGMTQAQAQMALERFILARASRGDRTILVITGKGLKKTGYLQIEQKGILRAMVPLWLNADTLAPLVAGVDPAHAIHGGEGALYVRLKRKRSNP